VPWREEPGAQFRAQGAPADLGTMGEVGGGGDGGWGGVGRVYAGNGRHDKQLMRSARVRHLFDCETQQLVEQALGGDREVYNRNAAANLGGVVRIRKLGGDVP
jgi:hypothetical protein